MGRGSKRGRDGRGGGGGFEDQYGEGMMSQDRGDRQPPGGGSGSGFKGGGSAGGSIKDRDVKFVRNVPKFLQGHMHLLGRKEPEALDSEDEPDELPTIEEGPAKRQKADADSDDDRDHQEALEKAIMDNPELANEFPELEDIANRVKAHAAKEAGNQAFAAKDYQKAVQHFTEALQHRTDAVYFSNRAAAQYALRNFKDSLQDAKQVVILDKKWVKGYTRLGAALYALEEWSEAKEAYRKAYELESDDASLRDMLWKCEIEEKKAEGEGKVKFKTSRMLPKDKPGKSQDRKAKRAVVLSFDAEEGEED